MVPEMAIFHKALAERIAVKKGEKYSEVITYIRTALNNLAIKSLLLCLRGSRARTRKAAEPVLSDFEMVNNELRNDCYRLHPGDCARTRNLSGY